jgi:hypothetical protein
MLYQVAFSYFRIGLEIIKPIYLLSAKQTTSRSVVGQYGKPDSFHSDVSSISFRDVGLSSTTSKLCHEELFPATNLRTNVPRTIFRR